MSATTRTSSTGCDCGACETKALKALLAECLYELDRHADDDHHVTPPDLIDRVNLATKGTPCQTTPSDLPPQP